MQTSTKQTPKSCSCSACKLGKHTKTGHFFMRVWEKGFRQRNKLLLDKDYEPIMGSAPAGNYFD